MKLIKIQSLKFAQPVTLGGKQIMSLGSLGGIERRIGSFEIVYDVSTATYYVKLNGDVVVIHPTNVQYSTPEKGQGFEEMFASEVKAPAKAKGRAEA